MSKKDKNEGITLVALVITVIILIILAGVAMSMIARPEGLFEKANYAATGYKKGALNEADKLAELNTLLEQYSGGNDGTGGENPTPTAGEIPVDSVKNVLTVNLDGVTAVEKSSYVLYEDKNGNNIRCRVLYSDDTNGVQLVSEDIVTTINPNPFDGTSENTSEGAIAAINAYNNLITTLNNAARNYMNSSTTEYARCIGSNPINPETIPTKGTPSDSDINEYLNGTEIVGLGADTINFSQNQDFQRLQAIMAQEVIVRDGSGSIPSSYYNYVSNKSNCYHPEYAIASVDCEEYSDGSLYLMFGMYGWGYEWYGNYTGTCVAKDALRVWKYGENVLSGYISAIYFEYNIRPVFKLKNTVRVVDGEGTYENPYVLSL